MWEDVAKKRPQKSSPQPVDLQRPAEVDEWWTTHPKPQCGLEEHWYVCARPPCTYLWHFKYFTQYPLRKRQWRYIQTMSTEWMNELLCCFLPCTALVMNESKRKKMIPKTLKWAWHRNGLVVLSNGVIIVRNTNVYSVTLYLQLTKKTDKHIKDLKMTNG